MKEAPFEIWKVAYDVPYEGEMFSAFFTTEAKAKKFLEKQVKEGYERQYLEIYTVIVY